MSLKRIGRRNAGEPYFGRHAANRFDDPNMQFGACYCGLQLDTAIAESVLHDALPEKGQFRIRQEEIETRYLVTFVAGAGHGILRLADLTGQRAQDKFDTPTHTPLTNARGLPQANNRMGIVIVC